MCSTASTSIPQATASTEALKRHGFGVLTEIDVQATLKKKLDVDFRPYRILGARNPHLAYEALQAEDRIRTMPPCNVIIQQRDGGKVEVSAVDPVASMKAVENPKLNDAATKVHEMLRYTDQDTSGTRGRDKRPGLDSMLKDPCMASSTWRCAGQCSA